MNTDNELLVKLKKMIVKLETENVALKNEIKRHRLLLDSITDVLSTHDTNGNFTFVSSSCLNLFGLSPDEMIGRCSYDFMLPEFRTPIKKSFHALVKSSVCSTLTYQIIKKDKTVIWVESTNYALRDEENQVCEVISISRDITDRKKDEESAQETIRRLKATQQLSHIGNWEFNLKTQQSEYSAESYKIFGFEHVATNVSSDIVSICVLPEYKQMLNKAFRELLHGKTYKEEFKIRRANDNQIRTIFSKAEIFYDDFGQPFKAVGIFQDISEQKQIEEALLISKRRLVEAQALAHIGNWELDMSANQIWASSEAFRIYGLDRISPKIPLKTVQAIALPQYRNQLDEALVNALKGMKYEEEYKIRRASDGMERIIYSKAELMTDDKSNSYKLVGVVQDVTERKKREDEIKYISYHDKLTGLYNRRFFEEEIQRLRSDDEYPFSIIIGDINGLKLINDVFGHTEGDRIIQTFATKMKQTCRQTDIIARWGGDEIIILLPNTDEKKAELIYKRIDKNIYHEDHSLRASISLGYATMVNADANINQVLKSAEDFMYRRKLLEGNSLISSILSSIISTLKERNIQTEEHSDRLKNLSRMLGSALDVPENRLDDLELLAVLHDIGKIAIKDVVINKPSSLSDEEWREMKRHSEIGYHIAKSTPQLHQISEFILSHHERWDGSGYPRGLKADEIPYLSRIIAVIDAFDAMTNDRPYSKAMSVEQALSEIEKCAGTQFDPQIAYIFCNTIRRFYE
ncbi:MAG: hypothetical protein BGN88_03395 [Clostridiales bacterium 43-6]|nr:MAG: hypothetical protein BGN88_03395 [Clostridiales bacterium 43-6]